MLKKFTALAFLMTMGGGDASATTTLRAIELRCVQSGVADVRVTGTLHMEPLTPQVKKLRGTLDIDITRLGLSGPHRVLRQNVLVSGEYAVVEHEATAAALNNDAIAVLHFKFARDAKSYIEYDGVRYPTTCELVTP